MVEPSMAATTTYYLTKNKQNTKKSRAMLINTYQNSAKGSSLREIDIGKVEAQEQRSPKFAS